MLNSIDVYTEAGTKAAQAVHENDWARFNFHRDWALRAVALEGVNGSKARDAYNSAYRKEREKRIPRVV